MPKTAFAAHRFTTRAAGILGAGILQAGLVWALVAGLDIRLGDTIRPVTEVFFPKTAAKTPPVPATPPEVDLPQIFVPRPAVVFDEPAGGTAPTAPAAFDPRTVSGPADHGPVSLMASHTIPPYPPIDARLGNEGTVVLRLVIGPDGRIRGAEVVRSSGFEGLDRAAQAWVLAHWRYQGAVKNGIAVESAANVAVTFNLKRSG